MTRDTLKAEPHFNRLTPAEAERLAMLAEEAAEVIQIVGKILRHGYDRHDPLKHPAASVDNRVMLAREIGDLSGVIDLMRRQSDIDDALIGEFATIKLRKLPLWTHHQETHASMTRVDEE